MAMSAKQLLGKAAECQTCGKEHKPHQVVRGAAAYAPSWAAPDGHPYRPRLRVDALATLRALEGA